MNNERELMRQIILWLWSRHRRAVSNLSGTLGDIHEWVSRSFAAFADIELENLLSQDGTVNFEERGKFLFLEPPKRGNVLPILSIYYDYARSIPEVRFRLAIFLLDENLALRAIGYRFESPEGEGMHHYYHAQPIRALHSGHQLPCPNWIPTRQPAFALDAKNSLTLAVCLLISIYGLDYVDIMRDAIFWPNLRSYIEGDMMWSDPEFQPTYWRVRIGQERVYYKTWKEKNSFRQVMRHSIGATDIEEVSRRVFGSQDSQDVRTD